MLGPLRRDPQVQDGLEFGLGLGEAAQAAEHPRDIGPGSEDRGVVGLVARLEQLEGLPVELEGLVIMAELIMRGAEAVEQVAEDLGWAFAHRGDYGLAPPYYWAGDGEMGDCN